jgi:thiamine biosynthesis protein ThiS
MIRPVSETWTLQINGEPRTVAPIGNVEELLQILGLGTERVAIELNRRVIRRRDWISTPVADRDRVEIVQFVGGG